MFEQLVNDLRYTLRSISRYPLFAAVVVGTLALGIGGNTAIFSALQSVLLNPIRHPDADRIVMPWRQARNGSLMIPPTAELAQAWSERSQSFEWMYPVRVGQEVTRTGGREARVLASGSIPTALFRSLGALPHKGRFFAEDDPEHTVVVSYGYWQSQYGGAAVTGTTIALDGDTYTVIGVAPRGFTLPTPSAARPDVWFPFRAEGSRSSEVLALLAETATVDDGVRELSAIMSQLAESDPSYGDWDIVLHSPREMLAAGTGQTMWMLFGAVGLVLLIACLNVANLLIARAKAREREFAVRTALGASRIRLLRQAMVEAVVLALAGGAAGLLFAAWAIDAILALRPAGLEALDRIAIDGRVLWFTLGTSLGVGILLGLLPAFHNTSGDTSVLLRAGIGLSHRGYRLRATLVTTEVALSMTLLVTTALIVRSMSELQGADPGFEADQLVAGRINLPSWKYTTDGERLQYYVALRDALSNIPGVTGVTRAGGIPPRVGVNFGHLEIEGIAGIVEEGIILPGADARANYFDVIGQPIVEGRTFTTDEVERESPVYIVNEAFAAKHFPNGSALGSHMRLRENQEWRTIVGVVGNVRAGGLANDPGRPMLYEPSPNTGTFTRYILRVSIDPASILPTIRSRVSAIDPDVPVRDLATVSDMLAQSISRQRFAMTLLVLFAATAVSMAVIGIYGVLSQIVVQRTREIGIRVALGSSTGRVRNLIVSQAVAMTVVGLVIGAGLALMSTKLVESQLFGIGSRDAASFGIAAGVILAAASMGALLPAHRAAVVDPVEAVRAE